MLVPVFTLLYTYDEHTSDDQPTLPSEDATTLGNPATVGRLAPTGQQRLLFAVTSHSECECPDAGVLTTAVGEGLDHRRQVDAVSPVQS